ncbi:hypothetical protein SUGI_0537270 [Cryptomeria japonica]|uniref:homeobox-leucine zipper protein HAT22 n=1 Tax=Cryptomeria japonica TaxID=3369 RepID=UPI002408CAD9|nr:homeobox-leucine zipper protein HAT22 [Cryptomeria japonica]GLJ27374.1 hypothetical protein SUGI_0537270 [Cryptomeria japonica]
MGVNEECDTVLGIGLRNGGRDGASSPLQLDLLPLAPAPRHSSFSESFPWAKKSLSDEASAMPRQKNIDVNKLPPANYYSNQYEETHNSNRASSANSSVSSFHLDFNAIDQEDSYGIRTKRDRCGVTEDSEAERGYCRVSDEEEEGCGTRKKLRLSKQQSAILEESFKQNSTLNPKQKQDLGKQLNLRPRQVEVWFQNRRARSKLKQIEVDCEFLKQCYESLTEENRRLQKELTQLRSAKLASPSSPLYVPMAAATLSMCPSCQKIINSDNTRPFTPLQNPRFHPPYSHSSVAC